MRGSVPSANRQSNSWFVSVRRVLGEAGLALLFSDAATCPTAGEITTRVPGFAVFHASVTMEPFVAVLYGAVPEPQSAGNELMVGEAASAIPHLA